MSAPVIVLLALLGLGAALLTGAWFAMRYALLRGKDLDLNIDEEILHSHLKKHYDTIRDARSWVQERPHFSVACTSFDGLRLTGTYIPHPRPRAAILLFHGWRSNPYVDFGPFLRLYWEEGLSILLVNQRSHGDSEGKYITLGALESRDVGTWIRWHNREKGPVPLLLGGVSMGASTVLLACGRPLPSNVRGVLADCGFTSPYAIARKVSRDICPPGPLLMPFFCLMTRLCAHFSMRAQSTPRALRDFTRPVFFAHGTGDAFVPWEMTRQAHEACGSKIKPLLLVPGAAHCQCIRQEPEKYGAMVRDFLAKALNPGPASDRIEKI